MWTLVMHPFIAFLEQEHGGYWQIPVWLTETQVTAVIWQAVIALETENFETLNSQKNNAIWPYLEWLCTCAHTYFAIDSHVMIVEFYVMYTSAGVDCMKDSGN